MEDVRDQRTINIGHIKSQIYNIKKNRNLQTNPRKIIEDKKTSNKSTKEDERPCTFSYKYYR